MIIETCPKCGCDLQNLCIMTYPPIQSKRCFNCGWYWENEAKREEIIRIPFNPMEYKLQEQIELVDQKD